MSASSQTGRFWTCPRCKKHVPSRSETCICDFDRRSGTEYVADDVSVSPPSEGERSSRRGVLVFGAVALVVLAGVGECPAAC